MCDTVISNSVIRPDDLNMTSSVFMLLSDPCVSVYKIDELSVFQCDPRHTEDLGEDVGMLSQQL